MIRPSSTSSSPRRRCACCRSRREAGRSRRTCRRSSSCAARARRRTSRRPTSSRRRSTPDARPHRRDDRPRRLRGDRRRPRAAPRHACGDALLDIYAGAGGDAERFRQAAEGWFDDQMERLSGVYKRWSQWFVSAISLTVVLALNANTLRMAETLWNDPAARATLVAQASTSSKAVDAHAAVSQVSEFPLPLGWSHASYSGWSWLFAGFGALLTLGAISLGAPFWFDALSRIARIRQTGTPPVVTGATRSGRATRRALRRPDGDRASRARQPVAWGSSSWARRGGRRPGKQRALLGSGVVGVVGSAPARWGRIAAPCCEQSRHRDEALSAGGDLGDGRGRSPARRCREVGERLGDRARGHELGPHLGQEGDDALGSPGHHLRHELVELRRRDGPAIGPARAACSCTVRDAVAGGEAVDADDRDHHHPAHPRALSLLLHVAGPR